jgi:regulator of sigma E protease
MGIVVFFGILGVLILIHEIGHALMASRLGVRIERFSLGFGPKLFSFRWKQTKYIISSIPLGGYVKFAGDDPREFKGRDYEYLSKSPRQRAKIIFCGPLLNYIFGFLCFWMVFFVGYPTLTTKVGELIQGYPAQEVGILPGDRIIEVDNIKVKYWHELQKNIQNKTQRIKLLVKRDNKTLSFSLVPKLEKIKDIWGEERELSLIGIRPAGEIEKIRHNLFSSFFLGAKELLEMSLIYYKVLGLMLIGKISLRESLTGPLGILYITAKTVPFGFSAVLHLMAILNLSLAIFNLLPLPILDGGHLLFLGLEKLRKRRLQPKTQEIIEQIGIGILLLLFLFVFYNDLGRFGIWEKISKWLKH